MAKRLIRRLKDAYWALRSDRRILSWPMVVCRDPSVLSFGTLSIRSMLPGRGPLTEQVPWITYGAIRWLENTLTRDMSVFEFGSGGSTLFLAARAGKVVSIEHDAAWYQFVSQRIAQLGIHNCDLQLAEPQPLPADQGDEYGPHTYTSRHGKRHTQWFENYVTRIDSYPDASFDLVIVDGASRAACIQHALTKVRRGGYLMLDNAERKRYRTATDSLLKTIPPRVFRGTGPARPEIWETTIWQIGEAVPVE
jgi:predicted O-methyltransferase YrrM